MKISERWLREWVNPSASATEIAEVLTLAGLEVEATTSIPAVLRGITVAHVREVVPHPNADRLRVCQVNTGEAEEVTIVCGAPNVRAGMKVPLAQIGAVMPDGRAITQAELRGVTSHGMLCSASELGLSGLFDASVKGLLELPEDAPVGADLADYLRLPDHIWTINITPNRGDCLSVMGIARELAALYQTDWQPPFTHATSTIEDKLPGSYSVTVADSDACPYYAARVIDGLRLDAKTPLWLMQRLMRAGIRAIHPIVDVTNYVMLELGQPLHAFDKAKLSGAIEVRWAKSNESLVLLNGQAVELSIDVLLIADKDKPLALAGIMGGQDSAVSAETTSIVLESAHFSPKAIVGRARRYNLSSDASHRFERGVDPSLPLRAIERATELLLAIAGGQAGAIQAIETPLPTAPRLQIRKAKLTAILGVAISDEEIESILRRLDMQPSKQSDGWQVVIPRHRFDVSREVDLIEEIARIYGYGNIPTCLPVNNVRFLAHPETNVTTQSLRHFLRARAYQEAVTYSFVDVQWQQQCMDQHGVQLANPIAADLAVMRVSLWPGLLQALQHNVYRQQERVRLFEMGPVFCPQVTVQAEREEQVLAGVVTGRRYPEHWDAGHENADLFDIKGDLLAMLQLWGLDVADIQIEAVAHPALHPGQAACLKRAGQVIATYGALHPSLQQTLDIPSKIFVFEIKLIELGNARLSKATWISKFPSIRRDVAIVVARDVSAESLLTALRQQGGEVLVDVRVFDVYQGPGVAEGCKSVAIALILQHSERTLAEHEITTFMQQAMHTLHLHFNAVLRESSHDVN